MELDPRRMKFILNSDLGDEITSSLEDEIEIPPNSDLEDEIEIQFEPGGRNHFEPPGRNWIPQDEIGNGPGRN